MTIPDVQLDERDFQDLVTEARGRIAERCPEWSEHNVSDPGITLIEQFAHMTVQLIYRVNRIPERMHIALLNLLDVELEPPEPSRALVRFDLTEPARGPLLIPAETKVKTVPVADDAPLFFEVEEDFTVAPVTLSAYGVQRRHPEADVFEWAPVTDGVARPGARPFSALASGADAFYLGFAEPLEKLVLRLRFDVTQAHGSGVLPRRPPLKWEASCAGSDKWRPVEVIGEDLTRGLNIDGHIELQVPQDTASLRIDGRTRHWLRCTFLRQGPNRPYTRRPVIGKIETDVIGARLSTAHAISHDTEELGISDGTAGQVFQLRNLPALKLRDDETLVVEDPVTGRERAWRRVRYFHRSRERDCHYRFDPSAGTIELGPRIRTKNGWRHYGAIPVKGARLFITKYRQAAPVAGNVDAGALSELDDSLNGIKSVTNPAPAEDGVTAETVAEARERASAELRSTNRAVTADDFEHLAGEASNRAERAHCTPSADGKAVVLSVLPRLEVDPSDGDYETAASRQLAYSEMLADSDLLTAVRDHLDEHRLLGTTLEVQPVRLRGVMVAVKAITAPLASVGETRDAIRTALFRFLNPLIGGEDGNGWGFGRPVAHGDLFAVVQGVEDVIEVPELRMYAYDPVTDTHGVERLDRLDLLPGELVCSGRHIVTCERMGVGQGA